MVMPETIEYLKSEIDRLEALPTAALIRENLERLKRAVKDAEGSMEATEQFYGKIKRHKARYPKQKGRVSTGRVCRSR